MKPWTPPKRFAAPDDLAAEPEPVKALRLLRSLRHFVKARNGVGAIQIDGQIIYMVKYDARSGAAEPDVGANA